MYDLWMFIPPFIHQLWSIRYDIWG
jgi:hypothetical protein